jgi:WD40 repeat protein
MKTDAPGEVMELGPRNSLPLPQSTFSSLTGDGKSFVSRVNDRLHIYDAATLTKRFSTEKQVNMIFTAVSPDGQWIASGTWHNHGVKVWNARTGALERDLPSDYLANVKFSPDGRWLVVGDAHEYQFWNVRDWKPGLRLTRDMGQALSAVAFTRDGKTVAVRAGSSVRLVDVVTGTDLALLEPPESGEHFSLCFVADDTRLVVGGSSPQRVWDLRLIRERLSAMGLDWPQPPLPAIVPKPCIKAVRVITED